MKTVMASFPMAIWAGREILRHPGQNWLLALSLASLVFFMTTVLLFSQALDTTWDQLLEKTPNLVVRRVNPGGWTPLPVDEALMFAGKVAGVLNPTPRIWGVVDGPAGPVTVVASSAVLPAGLVPQTPPAAGQAVAGHGVARSITDGVLILGSSHPVRLAVTGLFADDTGLATHDLVWTNPEDARALLGLSAGQASDLAIYLFHEEEEKAILADLSAAFPWPVSITSRGDTKLHRHTQAVQLGGKTAVYCVPALLALLFIISGIAGDTPRRNAYWGLLKSLGWGTPDLVRLQMTKALIVGAPAVAFGLSAAYAAVFFPKTAGIIGYWITGGQMLPALTLTRTGVAGVMLEVVAIIGLPCLATVFLAALRETKREISQSSMAGLWS